MWEDNGVSFLAHFLPTLLSLWLIQQRSLHRCWDKLSTFCSGWSKKTRVKPFSDHRVHLSCCCWCSQWTCERAKLVNKLIRTHGSKKCLFREGKKYYPTFNTVQILILTCHSSFFTQIRLYTSVFRSARISSSGFIETS